MKRLIYFCLLLLFATVVQADQVINLPEDGTKWYTSVWVNGESAVPGWFQSDSRLARLREQTHFNVVQKSDPQFDERYGKSIKEFPCVAITKADGTVLFKASGKKLPNNAADLVAMIRATVMVKTQAEVPENYQPEDCEGRCHGNCNGQCGRRNCRCRVRPAPEPTPQPSPPVPDDVPDLFSPEVTPEAEPKLPLWLGLTLAGAGFGTAVVPKIWKKYNSLEVKAE